ncbi:MAG: sigma-54-dependent Fis family transcriptional regulator [Gammaproteobacteria bacterium]|nr:sigma-54-dependent Fis family transcriptional regulator [Gammaproteobacteria bacterium]
MNILGNSPKFLQVLDKVCKIKKCDAPVFIDGETGTGKELIARAIHYLSERKDMPFIAANCGAFPDQLIENEFFGHEKGAYTDARESSEGLISQAEGGTLFLDEIETLSMKGQVSLLRFLETMMYRPLGSKGAKTANLRVITATNESISELVEKGDFRKDLYYRINIMNLLLPPLRERSSDINLLAEHFIRQYQIQYSQPERELHPDTQAALKYYDWPGNVRELENILHREFLLAEGKYITIDEIEAMTRERRSAFCDRRLQKVFGQPMVKAKKYLISEFEEQYLSRALDKANGNISKAARLAGKERRSFTRLMEKYHLDSSQDKTH